MILYKLTPQFTLDSIKREGVEIDHEHESLSELMKCKVGDFTVLGLLESGQCVLINKVWIVPERVTTSGEVRYSTDLSWSFWSDTHPNRIEHHYVARDPMIESEDQDSNIVKKSLHLEILQGYEKRMSDIPRVILTKYGPMLSSDLEERLNKPGRQEFWKAFDVPFSDEQLKDTENYEKRVLEDGRVVYLELVHASQIAQSS